MLPSGTWSTNVELTFHSPQCTSKLLRLDRMASQVVGVTQVPYAYLLRYAIEANVSSREAEQTWIIQLRQHESLGFASLVGQHRVLRVPRLYADYLSILRFACVQQGEDASSGDVSDDCTLLALSATACDRAHAPAWSSMLLSFVHSGRRIVSACEYVSP